MREKESVHAYVCLRGSCGEERGGEGGGGEKDGRRVTGEPDRTP